MSRCERLHAGSSQGIGLHPVFDAAFRGWTVRGLYSRIQRSVDGRSMAATTAVNGQSVREAALSRLICRQPGLLLDEFWTFVACALECDHHNPILLKQRITGMNQIHLSMISRVAPMLLGLVAQATGGGP